MSCKNCNNSASQSAYNPCNCHGTPYEACITEPLVPVCEDPEYCEEVFSTKCIVHNGPPLVNIGAEEGTRLGEILAIINANMTPITAEDIITMINNSDSLKATIIALLNQEN